MTDSDHTPDETVHLVGVPRTTAVKVMAVTALILDDEGATREELGQLDPADLDAFLVEIATLRDLIIKEILNRAAPA